MRTSSNEIGWVEDENHVLLGVALGFDFCAEHEQGAARLAAEFAVPVQGMGFDRMCAQATPAQVFFEQWSIQPPRLRRSTAAATLASKDPAKKVRLPKRPAEQFAALFVGPTAYGEPPTVRELTKRHLFMVDRESHYYDPEKHDVAAAWDSSEALVMVRGEENIARLSEIYKAVLSKDIVLNAPVQSGFTRRGGLSLGIASRFSQAFRDDVLKSDQAAARLETAVKESGVRALLKSKECGYYALSPCWHDEETKKGLMFFLNPQQQGKNNSGWFSLSEIQEWAQGRGPVPQDKSLIEKVEEFAQANNERPDFIFLTVAQKAGWKIGRFRSCWADAAHTRLGVNVRAPARGGASALPDGVYDLLDFQANPPLVPAPSPVNRLTRKLG